MPPYRKETTTRSHGCGLLPFGVLGLAMLAYVVCLMLAETDRGSKIIVLFMAAPLAVGFGYAFVLAVAHLRKPHQAWLQIDNDALSWRDWEGPRSMVKESYPLVRIRAVASPSEGSDHLKLADGTAVALPALVMGSMKTFRAELRARAPHIVFERCDGDIEPL